MSTVDKRNIDPIVEMSRIAEDLLRLSSRRFKESFRMTPPGILIYDSEWCRIRLFWEGWDYGRGNGINIRYGRLHATNEGSEMLWNGENCHCWHRVEHALHFLDGRTATEVAKLGFSHSLTRPFYQEDVLGKFAYRQPEWLGEMHVTIWEHYGQSLFELFDLRQPDRWELYRKFLKEVYDIAGRIPEIEPPMDKVC
jgi:hypothetical protein